MKVEGRKGSKRRGSYTAKQKLAVLEWYDAVCADPSIKGRIKAFELDHRSKSVPWTTITGKGGWGAPAERARLSKSCSKEYRQSLLRIDRDPARRRKGKYHDMEQEVIKRFKVRRARGRKVSPRWLTATSKSVMKELHPHVLWVGGQN